MAIQQDPSKSFGSTSYFQNKDEQRRVVNDMRREQRNKRIAQQGLTRNIKRAIRKGENPGAFINAAKEMGLDPLGGGGFGPEAAQRDAALRAKAAAGFEEVSQQRQKSDKAVGNKGGAINDKPITTESGGMVSSAPAINPANVDVTSAQTVEPVATGIISNKPKEPEWFTGDVKKDTTFKGVDLTETRFIGKSREEARQMVMSDKASKALRQFDVAGQALAQKEKDAAFAQEKQNIEAQGNIAREQVSQMDIDKKTQAALDPTNIAKQKADFAASQARSEEYKKVLERFDSIAPALDKGVESVGLFQDYTDASMAGIKAQSDITQRSNTSNIMRDAQIQRDAQLQADQQIREDQQRSIDFNAGVQTNENTRVANMITSANRDLFNRSTKGKIYNTGSAMADAVAKATSSIFNNTNPYYIK
jgi:hypothetical protein